MTGHSAHDDAGYVPEGLFEEWAKNDPLHRMEKHLLDSGEMTPADLEEMGKELTDIIDDAVDWADKQRYPDPEDCLTDVYFEG